jgi:hypothetical protein
MEEEIKRIPQGVALLSSTSIEMPVLVDIRVRQSEHGGRAVEMGGTAKNESKGGAGEGAGNGRRKEGRE